MRGRVRTAVAALAVTALVAGGGWYLKEHRPSGDLTVALGGGDSSLRDASLAVARADGTLLWSGGAGWAQPGHPMTADTPIYLSSVTKIYTATLVMMLVERGRLGLDHPMARYLPRDLIRGLGAYEGSDFTERITVGELLSHRSGIADYYTERGRDGRSLEAWLQGDPGRQWSVDEAIARVRTELPARSPPGVHTHYADTNFLLLGKIVEHVTGTTLAQAFEEFLFRPLGLRHTWLAGSARKALEEAGVAHVFRGASNVTQSRRNPVYWADGGLISTPREMIAFLHALRSGRLVSAQTVAAMQDWQPWRFPLLYGLGTMEFRLPNALARLAGLPPLWGHSGSTGSFLYYCEERGLYLAGTTNQIEEPWKAFGLMRRALRDGWIPLKPEEARLGRLDSIQTGAL